MEMTIDEIKSIINRNIALSQKELDTLSDIPSNDFQEGLCKGSIKAYEHIRKMLEDIGDGNDD